MKAKVTRGLLLQCVKQVILQGGWYQDFKQQQKKRRQQKVKGSIQNHLKKKDEGQKKPINQAVSIKNNDLTIGIQDQMKVLWDLFIKSAKRKGRKAAFDNTYTRQFNNIINKAINEGGRAVDQYDRFLQKLAQVIQQQAGRGSRQPAKNFKTDPNATHPFRGRQIGGGSQQL